MTNDKSNNGYGSYNPDIEPAKLAEDGKRLMDAARKDVGRRTCPGGLNMPQWDVVKCQCERREGWALLWVMPGGGMILDEKLREHYATRRDALQAAKANEQEARCRAKS